MTGEPVEAIYAALEASRHIGECAEHPEHLMDAENKARAAYPALDALVAQRREDELTKEWWAENHGRQVERVREALAALGIYDPVNYTGEVRNFRAEAAEARVAELTEALREARTFMEECAPFPYGTPHALVVAREALAAAAGEPEAATP